MDNYPENFEDFLATTAKMLETEGSQDAADLLKSSEYKLKPRKDQYGFDVAWVVQLKIDPEEYELLGDQKRDMLAAQIKSRLVSALRQETDDDYSVAIFPKATSSPGWRNSEYFVSRAGNVADVLDADEMQKQVERIKNAIDSDPALAIGTSKELVESCCKTILKKSGIPFSKSDDLPTLTKALTKALKLVPDDIRDKAKGADKIKRILRNLSALTHYIAELRGLYGTGHGHDGKHKGLQPRHARLVFASAVAFIAFVTETYHQRTEPNDGAKTPQEGSP